MKPLRIACFVGVSLGLVLRMSGQSSFQNLDFEDANLAPTTYGGLVAATDAIPGWTAYLGTDAQTQVLQNDVTLGNASIDILGPGWPYPDIIEGDYSVGLQPGNYPPLDGQLVGASISQNGLVPADAQSLQFKLRYLGPFAVMLGGQTLSLVPLGTGANYTLYGANISQFAGQTQTLTVAIPAQPNTLAVLDSIVFSSEAVPEPSTFVLGALALLIFRWRIKK
jgi:hypothetical protein